LCGPDSRQAFSGVSQRGAKSAVSIVCPDRCVSSSQPGPEYYAKDGNAPDGFIHRLYRDLLGREPTAAELAFWMRRMYHEERSDVAYDFLMRYPQSWQASPALAAPPTVAVPAEVDRYEYRRRYWHNWHEDYRDGHRDEHRERERREHERP
jgi:hypothetical protein